MKHIHFDEIDSTSTYLKREYQNLDNLTFVSASFQSSGHGRNSRIWESSRGKNLLFSYLVKDQTIINNFSHLSMFSAILVSQYLENIGLKDVTIKWPNDVYVRGKKIAGILLEGEYPNYIIVGIGLNVFQEFFPNDLRHPATSIVNELGNTSQLSLEVCSDQLFSKINNFWSNFDGNLSIFNEYLQNHNYLLNKKVKVTNNNETIEGIVINIDLSCNILLENSGKIYTINSGEIEIL